VFYTGKFDGSNLSIGNVDGGTSASKNNVVNGTDEIILVSYNLDGNANWSQTISSIADDMGQGMTLDADSIYLTGEVDNGVSFPGYAGNPLSTSAKRDIFISSHAKSDGITGWVHIIPCTGDSDERGFCLDADNFGNLYVIGDYKDDLQFPDGVTLTAISGDDVFVAGYTTDGDFGWAESAGSSQKDEGYGLAVGLEGSLYICGRHDNQMGLGSLTLPDNDSWNGFLAKLQGLIPPPANDNPCSAILLPVGDTCASEIDDNIGATDSGIPDPGCGEYRDGDVWFKAVIPPSGNLFIGTDASDDDSYPPVDGWMYRVEMAVYSGTCGSLNMEGCYSHNSGYHYRASSAYLFDKNPGDTIWIRVWEAFGDDFGNFSICTFDPGHFPAWDIPEMLCSNEGMIDLDTTLAELITGFVDGVTGSSGVPDPDDAVSTPDAATARLFDDGDWITLDLTDTIPAGEPYIIYFRSNTSVDDPTQMTLRASQNSVDFIEHSFKPETELDAVTSYYIIAEHPTRYIYIGNHGAGGGGFAVDGIKYFYRGTMGGTWSGPGVTGSIFDPSALLGAVSITYSLGGTTTDSDSTITTQIMKSDAGTLGNDTTICTGDHSVTLDLQGFNGSVIKWESSEDGFLSTNPIANTDPSNIVSGLLQTTSFRVIVQDGSCDPDTSNAVIVTVAEIPSANPGSYSDVCGANLGLQAIPSVGSGAWSTASGRGSATFTPSENNPTVSVEIDQYGTYLFTWTETNGNCTDDSTISVTFHEEPVADPGSGGDTCSTRFDLNAIPSVGVGQWSKISGPGSVFFTPSNAAPDAVASVSINGSYLFQWSETNAGCTSDANILVNYSKPPAVDPGPDDQTCGLDFTLNAVPSFGSGTWTLYTGPGTAQFSPSETAENATVSVTETGSYEFLWTESDGMCSNDSVISVAFIDIPVSNAGSGGEWCGPEYQLSALPSTGTGSWSHTAGPGTATFNPSPDLPDATVSASEPGKYEFTWTETNGICSDQDRIEVLFTDEMVVDAGTGRFTCGLQSDLVAFPADLTGHWSKFSGPGMVTYSPHDSATIASVTVDEFGLYVFQWEVIRGFCSGWDTVAIEFFNQPEADAGTDQILEFDFSTYLNAVSPELGYGTWSVLHGTGDIEHFNDPVSRVTGLELGLNEFIWTISSELCPDASDQVIVTVNDIQTSTVITPNMDGQNDFLVFP
ncbi:MAG: hypothetical protein GY790_02585, partial [Bacteroidetes bacterium]|nr:hypothetical protein [Bacteroidota bacterium]